MFGKDERIRKLKSKDENLDFFAVRYVFIVVPVDFLTLRRLFFSIDILMIDFKADKRISKVQTEEQRHDIVLFFAITVIKCII
jgi:hypothetical protein